MNAEPESAPLDAPLPLEDLRRLATRLTRCADLAEDVVQEALIALWQADEAPATRDAWLARVVANKSLQRLRALARRRKHECSACEPCPLSADPSRALERAELRAAVLDALDDLPPEFGEPLRLYELEGLDYREVAERLQMPVGTVRSRISRARRRLRERLERKPGAPATPRS